MTTHSDQKAGTLPTSDSTDAPRERETAPQTPESRKSALTVSDIRQRAREYFTPPSILTERQPSVPEKRRYARTGTWTTSETGPIRKAGIAYWRLIALPVNVVAGYITWIADRPGRALIIFLMWRMVISNPPGPWFTEHVLTPVGSIAAWLFL